MVICRNVCRVAESHSTLPHCVIPAVINHISVPDVTTQICSRGAYGSDADVTSGTRPRFGTSIEKKKNNLDLGPAKQFVQSPAVASGPAQVIMPN